MNQDPVGLVIGTEDAFALDFWVWVYPHAYLQLDDVVTVPVTLPDGRQVRMHGIVDKVRSRYEGARFDSDAEAAREQRLPVGIANAAHVTVTRVVPEIFVAPMPGTDVLKSELHDRNEALYFDKMHHDGTAFQIGFSRDRKPVYANIEFLDGTRGAHMNISGISGVATKTSYALFLLYSLLNSDALGMQAASTKAIIFNVKGEDLLFIDKPNKDLDSESRGQYEGMSLRAGPFQSVGIWAPSAKESDHIQPASSTRVDGVTAYAWSLSAFCKDRMLKFLFADADNETSLLPSVIGQVEDWLAMPSVVLDPDERGFVTVVPENDVEPVKIGTFIDLVRIIEANIEAVAKYATGGTRGAFMRRLRDAERSVGHLIRAISPKAAESHRIRILDADADTGGDDQVSVIDIHDLPDRAKRFVVGVVVRRLVEQKERGQRRPLVFLVLDELNKYAPRDGWSPIKDVILDIAERGRSLGVILIGAQQTASEIERRVTANASFRVVGRLDSAEAARGEYGFLTDAAKARASILKPGTMFVHQPEIPVPLLVEFPFPAWATRKDEIDLKSDPGFGLRGTIE